MSLNTHKSNHLNFEYNFCLSNFEHWINLDLIIFIKIFSSKLFNDYTFLSYQKFLKDLIAHYNIQNYFKLFIYFLSYFFLKSNILMILDILIYRNILCQYNLISALIIFLHQIFILKSCFLLLRDHYYFIY